MYNITARFKNTIQTSANTSPTPTQPSSSDARFNLQGVLAVSIAHFIHDVYSAFLAPLLPLLIEKLSLNLTQAGLLSTVMQLPALLNPWIGALADRISVRWFLVLAPSLTAIPMSLIGVAPTFSVLLVLMLFAGISVSIFHVPAPVVVARMAGQRKGWACLFSWSGGRPPVQPAPWRR
ncbi:MFS transporter [Desulfosarcina cetonica]|uniref:MFS transporter n=1 Tax=Desulfosarcina cetonica TaxID=90730 RepID=UPI000A9B579D|nr:MFS transporter [Desulfosarcina cetonica]